MKEKILIIGGTGFLGYHFAKACLKKNYKVISLSRNKPKPSRKLKKIKYLYVNIYSKILKKKILNIDGIKYVINFGGSVNHKNKAKVNQSHFFGVKNLVSALKKKNIKKFIQIGSSMEYGKMKSPHFEKNKKLMAISHYGKAKFKSTNFLIDCYKKKKFPAVIVRPYQVYGTHQDVNRLIPFVITNSLANKKYPISAGNQKRDLLFIADFVNGLEKIMYSNKHTNGEIFNIGYGKAVKVKDIVNLIKAIIKKGEPEFGKIKLRKEENLATFPNIDKIKKTIDWSPKTDLKKGILKTIMYYKKKK